MYPYVGLGGDELQRMALKVLSNEVGYHRVNLSTMFAGACWAVLAARPLLRKAGSGMVVYLAALTVVAAQALTAGRTGYAAWAALGLVLGALRWRRYLLLAPAFAMAVISFAPAVSERLVQGFTEETRDVGPAANGPQGEMDPAFDVGPGADLYTITSGRSIIWPYVLEKISEAPVHGFGRLAMIRTGLTEVLAETFGEGEAVGHPHNAYLEWLLDNGWLGVACIAPFYLYVLWTATSLFRDRRAPAFGAIGGITLALVGALLIGAIGSQTFYPREGSVGMWCAIGLMLRVSVERKRAVQQIRKATPRHGGGPRSFSAPRAAPPPPPPPLESLLWAKAS
jgi:O-antigen ligase